MENSKEVKNIADHQEQHHDGAPPPQGGCGVSSSHSEGLGSMRCNTVKYGIHGTEYLAKRADNPLQPPQSQQLAAMEEDGGESKQRPKTKEDYNWDPERCCCWGPGCFRRVLMENYDECCCTNVCFSICLFLTMVICSCRNRC